MVINIERIGKFSIYTEEDRGGKVTKTVFFDYRPVVRFDPSRNDERKVAVVELVELGYCNQKMAGKSCGFHRNTVFKLLRTKRLLGYEALFQDDRGPKTPWKYVGTIRSTIKGLLRKYPEWTDQQIAEEAASLLQVSISRSAVARIRTEKEDVKSSKPNKQELMDLAAVADKIDLKRHDARQLSLNFQVDPVFRQKSEEFSKAEPPKAETQTDKELLERLRQGHRNVFAGGLLHNLFLSEIDFCGAFGQLPGGSNTYRQEEILRTIFHALNLGVPSIESHKLVNSQDLGLLLGRSSSPDEATLRRRLTEMAQHYPAENLMDHFANKFLRQGFIDPEVFFIDGHFLPYYGLQIISKGYFTVRRLAMKGSELYALSDLSGRPLMFITEGCEIDFRPIIMRAAKKLISLGITRPLLVFDRGGYGVHFFSELSQKADFVTWAKYVGKVQLQNLEYTSGLEFKGSRYLIAEQSRMIRESAATAKKEGRKTPASLEVRMVVFKELDQAEPIAIYTSDKERPAGDIAYYMLSRWGESENFFKEMLARYNFNYHPGYDIKELENQPLVDNPEMGILKKTLKGLKQKLGQLLLERQRVENKLRERKDQRLDNKLTHIKAQMELLEKEVANFSQKIKELPQKISLMELLKGRKMCRLDMEKKKVYDLIQMLAYHSRERLVKIFRSCYSDQRDVKKVLDMIATRPGYVKLFGNTLIVLLDWIENRKHRQAAEEFCHRINQIGLKMLGRMDIKLFFRMSAIPQNGV